MIMDKCESRGRNKRYDVQQCGKTDAKEIDINAKKMLTTNPR